MSFHGIVTIIFLSVRTLPVSVLGYCRIFLSAWGPETICQMSSDVLQTEVTAFCFMLESYCILQSVRGHPKCTIKMDTFLFKLIKAPCDIFFRGLVTISILSIRTLAVLGYSRIVSMDPKRCGKYPWSCFAKRPRFILRTKLLMSAVQGLRL